MHKAKRNNNLSFSKGKTWSLEDMRVLEVIGVSDPSTLHYRQRDIGARTCGSELNAEAMDLSPPTSR